MFTKETALDLFFQMSPDLFCIAGTNGFFLDLNPAWEATLGFSGEELMSRPFAEFIHPDDIEPTFREVEKQLMGHQTLNFINRYRCKDNTYKWLEWRAIASENREYLYAVARDISERKRLDDEIKQIEARFHSAFDLPLIGITLTSPEKGWIEVNSTLQQMLGYSFQELDKLTWADLTYPEDIAEDEKQFNRVIDGEIDNYSLEKRFVRKNGEIIWTIMSAGCVRKPDGKVDYFVAMLQDISRQKEVEISLRESENKFRTLVENIGEGIGLMNNEEVFVFSNPLNNKIFGVENGELEGSCLFDFLTEASISQIKNETSKRNQGISSTYELELQLPDGSKKEILVTATPWSEGNKIIGTFGIFRDITLQKKNENALRLSEETMREINTTKDKFFSIIAHDLRSPFNAFLNLTQMMKDEFHNMGSDEMLRMVSAINDSANKVYRLLENLLEWSLIQRNMINVHPGLISLKKMSQAGLETMKDFALAKKVGLTCMVPEDLMVYTDEKMLVGTLRNLVSNAIKFTPPVGSITVSACILSEGEVEVSVKDTGIGMQKSLIDDLFKPGAHTSRPGTEGEPSSGLGLVLCKEFVEKNGGKIRVESEPGKGTTFYFTIPKNNPRSTNVEVIQPVLTRETKKIEGLKILLAEDDVASKLFLIRVLKSFSREILQAKNGTDAIGMCRLHPDIDLVLMDILMPEMDGYEATREIRKFNKDVVIIVQSTVVHVDGPNKAIEAGCNDFVSKPISFKKLKALIEKYFPTI